MRVRGFLIGIVFLLLMGNQAQAIIYGNGDELDFTWSFDVPSQTVGPNDTVFVMATITNSSISTINLRKYGANYGGIENLTGINGAAISYGEFTSGAGYTRVNPTSNIFDGLDVGIGESFSFEWGSFTPPSGGAPSGVNTLNGYTHINLFEENIGGVVNNIMIHSDNSFSRTVDGSMAGSPVPEPTTMLLFGTGLVGLVGSRFRKKKK